MTGVRFSEVMRGSINLGESSRELSPVQTSEVPLAADLTIDIQDIASFIADPNREADLSGWIECDALGGRLAIHSGVFSPFVFGENPQQLRMLYRVLFEDAVGHPLRLIGFKVLPGGRLWRIWPDTTELFVQIQRGHVEPNAELVASGIIRVHAADFLLRFASFRSDAEGLSTRALGIARYFAFFTAQVWRLYGPRYEGFRQWNRVGVGRWTK